MYSVIAFSLLTITHTYTGLRGITLFIDDRKNIYITEKLK